MVLAKRKKYKGWYKITHPEVNYIAYDPVINKGLVTESVAVYIFGLLGVKQKGILCPKESDMDWGSDMRIYPITYDEVSKIINRKTQIKWY